MFELVERASVPVWARVWDEANFLSGNNFTWPKIPLRFISAIFPIGGWRARFIS